MVSTAAQRARQEVGLVSHFAGSLLNVRACLLGYVASQRRLVEYNRDRSRGKPALLRNISQRCTSAVSFATIHFAARAIVSVITGFRERISALDNGISSGLFN